jgi:hypothetical protein
MRERLNNDPKVQLAVFGIVALVLAFILMTRVFSGGGSSSSADTASAPAAAGTPAPAATDTSAGTATTPAPSATAPAATGTAATTTPPATSSASATAGGSSQALLPTKGLPADVLVAYARNKVVVLLVVDPQSFGANRLKRYAEQLRPRDNVALFIVKPKDIARYSRITSGVSVSQTPALVVVRPRKLNADVPTATVSYGFRGPKSVSQAVDDALYKGGDVPPYPHG